MLTNRFIRGKRVNASTAEVKGRLSVGTLVQRLPAILFVYLRFSRLPHMQLLHLLCYALCRLFFSCASVHPELNWHVLDKYSLGANSNTFAGSQNANEHKDYYFKGFTCEDNVSTGLLDS